MTAEGHVFTLGHSPDPDDAFMFYALAANKIDLRGYRFEHRLEDIQTLNERALRGELHISAVSIHAYAYVTAHYALLPCGASIGDGYGPLIVQKRSTSKFQHSRSNEHLNLAQQLRGRVIAVPGRMTSAFLAVQLFLGEFDFIVVRFDEIFDAITEGRADLGLIIHEGQLTFAQAGFEKIIDLGEWWKGETGLPLPLGGNVIRKDIPPPVCRDILEIIRASIDYGLKHRDEAVRHALAYARNMNERLADKFIGMYVNEYTRDYGQIGRAAVRRFLGAGREAGYIDKPVEVEFVD
jgi:1,4-dihydroxy-6-naphthoate synthase